MNLQVHTDPFGPVWDFQVEGEVSGVSGLICKLLSYGCNVLNFSPQINSFFRLAKLKKPFHWLKWHEKQEFLPLVVQSDYSFFLSSVDKMCSGKWTYFVSLNIPLTALHSLLVRFFLNNFTLDITC